MEYTKSELNAVKINPSIVEKVKILGKKLTKASNEKVLEWIAYVYHPDTPLATLEDEPGVSTYMKRKFIAGKKAGFSQLVDGKFSPTYEEIVLGQNFIVNQKIVAYLKLFHSRLYAYMKLENDSYFNQMVSYMNLEKMPQINSTDIEAIAKARKQVQLGISTTDKKLRDLELQFLQGDDSPQMLKTLYYTMEMESLGLTPEEVADALEKGDDPLKGFKPNKL